MKYIVAGMYKSKCPVCKDVLRWQRDGKIRVNIESDGDIEVPGFFEMTRGCENPLCKWSKAKGTIYE
jgi:hypothetical protein